jgi:hypothetical protein
MSRSAAILLLRLDAVGRRQSEVGGGPAVPRLRTGRDGTSGEWRSGGEVDGWPVASRVVVTQLDVLVLYFRKLKYGGTQVGRASLLVERRLSGFRQKRN